MSTDTSISSNRPENPTEVPQVWFRFLNDFRFFKEAKMYSKCIHCLRSTHFCIHPVFTKKRIHEYMYRHPLHFFQFYNLSRINSVCSSDFSSVTSERSLSVPPRRLSRLFLVSSGFGIDLGAFPTALKITGISSKKAVNSLKSAMTHSRPGLCSQWLPEARQR